MSTTSAPSNSGVNHGDPRAALATGFVAGGRRRRRVRRGRMSVQQLGEEACGHIGRQLRCLNRHVPQCVDGRDPLSAPALGVLPRPRFGVLLCQALILSGLAFLVRSAYQDSLPVSHHC